MSYSIKIGLIRLRPILLILVLALALRLIALSSRTLWYDEAFAVLFSEKGLGAMLYGTLTPAGAAHPGVAADVHPLLYYTTLNGWMRVFGQSPFAVRFYSVILGLATIDMLYLLARELFGGPTGLTAAGIAAIAPFYVQYSQEARMYALLGLLLIAATWCFVRGWRSGKIGYWLAFGILAGLSMYAQQLAAFYLVALGLIPLLARRRDQMLRTALGAGVALALYFPWLINLPAQFGKIGNYWVPRPTVEKPLVTLWSYIFADLPVTDMIVTVVSITTLVLLLSLLIYRSADAFRLRRQDCGPLALVLWLVIVPIVLTWLLSQWRPVYLTRALLPSGLMFYVALAWLVTRSRLPRPVLASLAVPWLATIVFGLFTHYTWSTFPRPPFDAADETISDQLIGDSDRVVHANKLTMLPMFYYNRSLPQHYIRDAPGSGEDTLAPATQEVLNLRADDCFATAAMGSPRVWFVIFQEQIDQQGGNSPELAWLDAHYLRRQRLTFHDLLVFLYDQPDSVARRAQCEP